MKLVLLIIAIFLFLFAAVTMLTGTLMNTGTLLFFGLASFAASFLPLP